MKQLSILLVIAALSGCGGQPMVPQDTFYRLTAVGQVPSGSSRLDGVLVVPRFLADGVFSERPVVYATASSPETLQQYNYHFWAESPSRMLQELTVDQLRQAGAAPMVATPEFRAAATYELIGKIKRLEQRRGRSPGAVVSLEFGLYRIADRHLLFLKSYDQTIPANGEGVGEATAAMSRGVSQILALLAADIAAR